MRAVWIGVDERFLDERRRMGLDKKDELWDGVLHMVPPGSYAHGNLISRLYRALDRISNKRGLVANADGIGVFASEHNYRIPDATVVRPDQISKRGLEGAELVVEILSPDDESRDKLPFYAKVGVREVWLIEPYTLAIEVLSLRDRAWFAVPGSSDRVRSPYLDIEIESAGSALRLHDGDDLVEV